MKTFVVFFPLLFLVVVTGCCPSGNSGSPARQERVGTADWVQTHRNPAPASMKQNATRVEAVIEGVERFGETEYLLSVTIISCSSVGGVESIIEANQKLEVVPEYLRNDEGTIDVDNERNKKILNLRASKVGDHFSGIISRVAHGRVVLIEVLEK